MPKTILIHSFRAGVGRSNITANLAYLLGARGKRLAVIDTDTTAPMLQELFGLAETKFSWSFNDFLSKRCAIEQAAYDITSHLQANLPGQIFLVPANTRADTPAYQLQDTRDVEHFNHGCQQLIKQLGLDILLVDSRPGLSENPLVSLTISDTLLVVLRHDQRDYQGTGVTVDVVRRLDVPRIVLIINELPQTFNIEDVKTKIEQTYNCEVIAVLPHVEELMALANQDIFVRRYPRHLLTTRLQRAAVRLVE